MQHIFVELRDKFFCNFFVLIPANASVAPVDWNSFIGKFKYQLSRFNKPFYRLCRYGNLTQSPSNITYVRSRKVSPCQFYAFSQKIASFF